MENFDYRNFSRFYFCGICGVGMSALAKHLALKGKIVGGSDVNVGKTASALKNLGVKIYEGNLSCHLENFCPDVVVFSSAIDKNGEEMTYATAKKIPIMRRSELLNCLIQDYDKRIAVSGCHGKSTTTAMISRILQKARLSPTVFLGAEDGEFSNYVNGNGQIVVTEACEYDKNIEFIKPNISILLNIDNDHLDSYSSMQELTKTFGDFISNSLAFINADDNRCVEILTPSTVTFGIDKKATYMARGLTQVKGKYSFWVYRNNIKQRKIVLKIVGRHNVYNALAAYSVCDSLGVSGLVIKRALEEYQGIKRRMEYLGRVLEMGGYADYAHHPTEIKAVLQAIGQSSDKWLVVFQPHTYSRTKILINDFINVLQGVENLIIYKTYPAREKYVKEGSSFYLFNELTKRRNNKVYHSFNLSTLSVLIKSFYGRVENVLFLGAGDVYETAKKLL